MRKPYCTNGKPYTPDEETLLAELWTSGVPREAIVRKMRGRTLASILTRAHKLKLRRPNRPVDREADDYKAAFSRAWYDRQNDKFCDAMFRNPTERPSNMALKDEAPFHRLRRHPIHLPLTSSSLEMV